MKLFGNSAAAMVTSTVLVCMSVSMAAFAATTPSLGAASSFGVLSSTYTNTILGTTINGDLGYTTGPAVVPTVNGTIHLVTSTYNQAGIAQGAALASLNSQACTYTFAAGVVDLSTDTTHGPIGVYTPGVYCINGAASIGTGGITLDGSGTYIFKINGALTTVANSSITATGGASACDTFWAPTQAATLAANSSFIGVIIADAGITAGANMTWVGSALSFAGTVTTDMDSITVPECSVPVPPVVVEPEPEPVIVEPEPTPVIVPPVVIEPVPVVEPEPNPVIDPVIIPEPVPVILPIVTPTPVIVPLLPNTGLADDTTSSKNMLILTSMLMLLSGSLIIGLRKRMS